MCTHTVPIYAPPTINLLLTAGTQLHQHMTPYQLTQTHDVNYDTITNYHHILTLKYIDVHVHINDNNTRLLTVCVPGYLCLYGHIFLLLGDSEAVPLLADVALVELRLDREALEVSLDLL